MSFKNKTNKKGGKYTLHLLELEEVNQQNPAAVSEISIAVGVDHVNPTYHETDSSRLSSSSNDSCTGLTDASPSVHSYHNSIGNSRSSSPEYVTKDELQKRYAACLTERKKRSNAKKKGQKSFFQNILPCFLLSVLDGKDQRPKSFDGFEVEQPPLLKKSNSIQGHDSTCSQRERSSLITNKTGRLNTRLLDAIEIHNNIEVESMLHAGANPNATCRAGHISACHAAACSNSDALQLLLKFSAERQRTDKFGRTPLHLAAWAGKNWSIALLLDFPQDLQYEVAVQTTPQSESKIKQLRSQWASNIDVPCELPLISVLPQTWKDTIEHKCRRFMPELPKFFAGWTPLHIASYAAHHETTHLLLVAGASPHCKDAMGQTPLDVAGTACYLANNNVDVLDFERTIENLIQYGSMNFAPNLHSALHTAVELHSIQGIQMLMEAGVPVWQMNAKGNTPLHECVAKFYVEPLRILAKYSRRTYQPLEIFNSAGYTVLQAAIMASWIPGVCTVLDAGADVLFEARDGKTAIHIAALKGDLDIIDEILLNAALHEDAVNYNNGHTEPPILCAIRSGITECVQTFLDAGAVPKVTYYIEPNLGDTTMDAYLLSSDSEVLKDLNMILHATAEAGNADILDLLLEHDKSLEKLLFYECPYLKRLTPVEFAANHNKFFTFTYLLRKTLERASEKNISFDHSKLLYIIVTDNREEMFRELIRQIPNAVPMALGKQYYPLHVAARNSYRNLLQQLIHCGADLSERDDYGVTAISLLVDNISKPTEFLEDIFDNYVTMTPYETHNILSEITIDYKPLIPETAEEFEGKGQFRVLKALLKTGNKQNQRRLLAHPLIESFLYLKWKTLSTYFYVMVFLHFLFVMSLSVFTVSAFYYKDKYNSTLSRHPDVPRIWNPVIWKCAIYVTLGIVAIQELFYLLFCSDIKAPRKWIKSLFNVEFWVKTVAWVLAVALPLIISAEYELKPGEVDWKRHLATVTLVVAWLSIMMLLSKTPMAGYYMQMFWKISSKIIQILVTFMFLILMFSFCFMLQFHAQVPFEGPWAAVVKTLVMMTSEFDYSGTFSRDMVKNLSTPIQLLRLIFVVFLILTAIVLMNLTIGIAVNDIQNLVNDGNLKRLDKQVGFLNRLEASRRKSSIFHILRMHRWLHFKKIPQKVTIKHVNVKCCYSSVIKEALVNKAQEQMSKIERKAELNKLETNLENITRNMRNVEINVLYHILDLKSKMEEQYAHIVENCRLYRHEVRESVPVTNPAISANTDSSKDSKDF